MVKAQALDISREDVERRIHEEHAHRERNHGAVDWRVTVGRIVVIYNHPDDDDPLVARVVTVWRHR